MLVEHQPKDDPPTSAYIMHQHASCTTHTHAHTRAEAHKSTQPRTPTHQLGPIRFGERLHALLATARRGHLKGGGRRRYACMHACMDAVYVCVEITCCNDNVRRCDMKSSRGCRHAACGWRIHTRELAPRSPLCIVNIKYCRSGATHTDGRRKTSEVERVYMCSLTGGHRRGGVS